MINYDKNIIMSKYDFAMVSGGKVIMPTICIWQLNGQFDNFGIINVVLLMEFVT